MRGADGAWILIYSLCESHHVISKIIHRDNLIYHTQLCSKFGPGFSMICLDEIIHVLYDIV